MLFRPLAATQKDIYRKSKQKNPEIQTKYNRNFWLNVRILFFSIRKSFLVRFLVYEK
jgi:hypothetical protein